MADLFVESIPLVAPRTIPERHAARRAVAGFATDATDLTHLLTVLALWPSQDTATPPLPPAPSWDSGRK